MDICSEKEMNSRSSVALFSNLDHVRLYDVGPLCLQLMESVTGHLQDFSTLTNLAERI